MLVDNILENLNSGVVYLYSASSRREYYETLEWFFTGLFDGVEFSVLREESPGQFSIEYLSGVALDVVDEWERQVALPHPESAEEAAGRWGDSWISCGSVRRPIADVRTLADSAQDRTFLALHQVLDREGTESLGRLDAYLFDHVAASWAQMEARELARRVHEQNELKVEAIQRIGVALETLDVSALLSRVVDACVELCDAQVGSIQLLGESPKYIEWGLPQALLACVREVGSVVPDGCSESGREVTSVVSETGEPVLIPDFAADDRFETVALFRVESFLCVPVLSKGRVLATIHLVNSRREGRALGEAEKHSASIVANLAAAAIDNALLHRKSLENEKVEASLHVAREIQRDMYPRDRLEVRGYECAWVSESCDETGGDVFDFLEAEAGKLSLAIGDVSGHGIGSALLMATCRASLRALLSVGGGLVDVVTRLNNLLEEDLKTSSFITLFLAELDLESQAFSYVNAAHDPPIVYRRATDTTSTLESSGLPLGMFAEWEYVRFEIEPLFVGDGILLTTDGVWEQVDSVGERLGKARLAELFRENAHLPAQEILDAVLAEVRRHARGVPVDDDQTIVVVKRV